MFYWNKKIYMDDVVKKKPMKYRRIVKKKKVLQGYYCITLPKNRKNCMDIYSSRELWFQCYQNSEMHILGLAADRIGAEQILCKMILDIYNEYGEVNEGSVRKFFEVITDDV